MASIPYNFLMHPFCPISIHFNFTVSKPRAPDKLVSANKHLLLCQKNLCCQTKLISPKLTVLRHFTASDRGILWFNRNTWRISGFFLQSKRIFLPYTVKWFLPRLLLALWRTVTARVPVLRPSSEDVPWSGYVGPLGRCGTEAFLSKSADIAKVEKCAGLKFGWHYATQTRDIVRQSRTHIFHKSRIYHIFFFIAF